MKRISFWLAKGGTGKTTTAGNVASHIAHQGRRVLMIDADPQGNLSSWFLTDAPDYELADVLTGKATPAEATVTVRDNLDLVPTFGIGGELEDWQQTRAPLEPFAIENVISQIHGYDTLVFDIGPGRGAIGQLVNSAVDEIIPVLLPEFFSADGLEIFADYLDTIRRTRKARAQRGPVVVNRVNERYAAHGQYKTLGAHVVGQSTDIHDSLMVHQTLIEYAPRNRWNDTYREIAGALWH